MDNTNYQISSQLESVVPKIISVQPNVLFIFIILNIEIYIFYKRIFIRLPTYTYRYISAN